MTNDSRAVAYDQRSGTAAAAQPSAAGEARAPHEVLRLDDVGFFLDIDGTLLDIAARPTDVDVPAALVEDLKVLTDRLDGALALVSGRTVADIDTLFGDLEPRASGAHGAELRFEPAGEIVTVSRAPIPDAIREGIEELALRVHGVLIEDKGVCLAVHYREAPTAGDAVNKAIATLLADYGDPGLGILPGRLVFEVKHLAHSKGTAVEAFMEIKPFAGRRPVFLGDDVTDQAAFSMMPSYGGLAYSVGRDFPGIPRGFDTAADVRAWLSHLARRSKAK